MPDITRYFPFPSTRVEYQDDTNFCTESSALSPVKMDAFVVSGNNHRKPKVFSSYYSHAGRADKAQSILAFHVKDSSAFSGPSSLRYLHGPECIYNS